MNAILESVSSRRLRSVVLVVSLLSFLLVFQATRLDLTISSTASVGGTADLMLEWLTQPHTQRSLRSVSTAAGAATITTSTTSPSTMMESSMNSNSSISTTTSANVNAFHVTTMTATAIHPNTSSSSSYHVPSLDPFGSRRQTVILSFSDVTYSELALQWYQEMTNLGYVEHTLVAMDQPMFEICQRHNLRCELLDLKEQYRNCTYFKNQRKQTVVGSVPPSGGGTPLNRAQANQIQRRQFFAIRWQYIRKVLQEGHNVLLSDADNMFRSYFPMSSLESSPVDVYHSYAGGVGSFPRNIYVVQGFTVCGCLSWWRSNDAVLKFIDYFLERCGCTESHDPCECMCDDQVVLNNVILKSPYKVQWDDQQLQTENKTNRTTIAWSDEELSWDGKTGTCQATGHRVAIWDRHFAHRMDLKAEYCPNASSNWAAMPVMVNGIPKTQMRPTWQSVCGAASMSGASSGGSIIEQKHSTLSSFVGTTTVNPLL